jgi:hypothetical protein
MKIELSDADANLLTLAIGVAIAAVGQCRDRVLATEFLRLANIIHKDDPGWSPYNLENFAERRV